ncbi:MAG: hypothetical protein ABL933_06505 [Methyloglobulus sp.]|nr:hypothetical protein [Methyloglobulus sp.]
MAKDTTKPAAKTEAQPSPDIENDSDDLFEDVEVVAIPTELDKDSRRRDARRKIEIYWEKKHLKDQFEDIDESEFDF